VSRINVKVVPRARQNSVIQRDGVFVVHTTAPADDGKANAAVIRLIADHYDTPRSRVRILHGQTARHKLVEVLDAAEGVE
jgi:uncharacterized protein (TIGR00251 family)